MKKYVYLMDNKAYEIIDEFNPIFPNIPITERYSAEFLAQCAIVDESVLVEQRWEYDKETNTFTEPVKPTEPSIENEEETTSV